MPKIDHIKNEGYAFASINYRLVPLGSADYPAIAVVDAWLRKLLRAQPAS